MFDELKPFLIIGLALGGLYAVSGVGLVILYRTTGVVNLAYGAVGAMSGLLCWELIHAQGFNEWLAFAACIVIAALITVAYGSVFGPLLARRDASVKAIATLGLMLGFLGLMSLVWGEDPHTLTLPTTNTGWEVLGTHANLTQAISLALGIAVTAGAAAFLKFTSWGTAMRAVASDREIAASLGIPVGLVERSAWAFSGALCGVTTLLLANLYGLDYVGLTFLVFSGIAAALVGGLRYLSVTMIAGILIGVLQSSLTISHPIGPYRELTPFVFAIIALLWLSRRRVITIASGLSLDSGSLVRRRQNPFVQYGSGLVVVAAAFVLIPLLSSGYWTQVFLSVTIYSVVALGAGLLLGRVGIVSLCQIALLAVGAWAGLRVGYATSLPFPLVLLAAGLITGLIGVLIGLPALRLSGLHLALITLMAAGGIGVLLTQLNFPNGGGGVTGYSIDHGVNAVLRGPSLAGGTDSYFRYALVVAALMFALVAWRVSGPAGRAWATIRQSEPAALASGLSVVRYKLLAFFLASFVTGVAGALLAASPGGVTTQGFPTQDSIILLATVLMGGIYGISGAVVAGLLLKLLPALLESWGVNSEFLLILFGLGLLQVLVTSPGGLSEQVPKDLRRLGRLFRRLGSGGSVPGASSTESAR